MLFVSAHALVSPIHALAFVRNILSYRAASDAFSSVVPLFRCAFHASNVYVSASFSTTARSEAMHKGTGCSVLIIYLIPSNSGGPPPMGGGGPGPGQVQQMPPGGGPMGGMPPGPAMSASYTRLKVEDALHYLDQVKLHFQACGLM